MENPVITVTKERFVLINQRSRNLAISVEKDASPLKNLICSFMEDNQSMYAAVIAPQADHHRLARRVVSFLSAYMRIEDADELEREVRRCIETCLHSRHHKFTPTS